MSLLVTYYDTPLNLSSTFQTASVSQTNGTLKNITGIMTNTYAHNRLALKTKTAASAVNASGTIRLWLYALVDIANNLYSDGSNGSTVNAPVNAKLIKTLRANSNSLIVTFEDDLFNYVGAMPQNYFIALENATGTTLSGTSGDFSLYLNPVSYEYN